MDLTELIATSKRKHASILSRLERGIDVGVAGKMRIGGEFLCHRSTRPGEVFRVTLFDGGDPTGHVAFSELREMASYVAGIAKIDCV